MNARVGAVPTVRKMSKSVDRRCPKGLKEGKTREKAEKSMAVKAGMATLFARNRLATGGRGAG